MINHKNQSENSYFQIYCTVQKGSEPLRFEWSKNGEKIIPSSDMNHKIDSFERYSTLTIKSLDRKDSANYGCVVSNDFGSDAQNILLTVEGMQNSYLFIDNIIDKTNFNLMIV